VAKGGKKLKRGGANNIARLGVGVKVQMERIEEGL